MLVNGTKFTIGADPEIFVEDAGKIISAWGLIEGDKARPSPVQNGAVQVDGMALEFNIDPAEDSEGFISNLNSVKDQLAAMIGDKKFVRNVSTFFDKDYLSSLPDEALILGCDEDYNGYTLSANPSPNGSSNMRTVGGHVHVGGFIAADPFEEGHFKISARLARILDEQVGIYSLFWDEDDQRRGMYGKAGSFRPKEYGMEYRTLSNSWIFDNKLMKFVYDGVERALGLMFDPSYEPHPEVENIINSSDRKHMLFRNNPRYDEVMNLLEA